MSISLKKNVFYCIILQNDAIIAKKSKQINRCNEFLALLKGKKIKKNIIFESSGQIQVRPDPKIYEFFGFS